MATESISNHSSDSDAEYTPEEFAHPSPVRTLVMTFGALVVLTLITVIVAVAFDMGRFEVWVSLGIASVKATLVICFFMHMLHDKPFNAMFFLSSFFFVAMFIGITLMDSEQYQDEIRAVKPEDLPEHKVGRPRWFDFTGSSGQ